jgi:2-oxopent-4-enoate hydratase
MSISESKIDEIVSSLLEAEEKKVPIDPITKKYPNMNINDAYRIQLKLIDERKRRGEVVIGKKVGLTSKAMQELARINEPDYGFLTDRMVVYEDFPISLSELIQPRVEAEIAFVLKSDLKGPGVIVTNVLHATDYIMPSLEIIDSRQKRDTSKRRIEDSISDNAGTGRVVFGGRKTPIENLDLRYIGLVFEKNGMVISTAAGAAVLGNPVQAVAWLANKLSLFGVTLYAGETILSGSLIAAVNISPGDSFSATFDHIGSVKTKFIE